MRVKFKRKTMIYLHDISLNLSLLVIKNVEEFSNLMKFFKKNKFARLREKILIIERIIFEDDALKLTNEKVYDEIFKFFNINLNEINNSCVSFVKM